MFDLQLALKPFKDPRILAKMGIIFGVYAISSILQYFINLTPYISGFIPTDLSPEAVQNISSIISLLGSILIGLILFPATLYILGYTYKISDRIRTGNDEVLPEHDDLGDGIKIGGIAIGFSFLLTMPFIVLISILLFLLISLIDPNVGAYGMEMGFGIFASIIVLILLGAFFLAFTDIFLVPIYMYRYLTTKNFAASFSFKPFIEVLKVSWIDWLVVFFMTSALGMAAFGVQLVLCCLGPFVTPFINTVTVLVTAGLTGAVYNKIDLVTGNTSGSNSAG